MPYFPEEKKQKNEVINFLVKNTTIFVNAIIYQLHVSA